MAADGVILRCAECGRQSTTGLCWRAYLVDDLDDEDPAGVAVFCPSCAEREFGCFGGDGDSPGDAQTS